MVRKQYEDAVIEYRKSAALDPYDASVINRLGIGYLQLRMFTDAAKRVSVSVDRDLLSQLSPVGDGKDVAA